MNAAEDGSRSPLLFSTRRSLSTSALLRHAPESEILNAVAGESTPPPRASPKQKKLSMDEIKKEITQKVTTAVRSRSGPSFEERLMESANKKIAESREVEKEQKVALESAVARGRMRPCSSPIRPKHKEPEPIEARNARGLQTIKERDVEYKKQKEDLKTRMREREPLYKLEEVAACIQELKDKQAAHQQELKEDEKERWEFIRSIQAKVVDRPMLMDQYRKVLTSTDLRRMASPTKTLGIDLKVQKAIQRKDFLDSPWMEEVNEIKERQNLRPRLHEIPYPKTAPPKPGVRPRELGPLERQISSTMEKTWFKNSDWAGNIREMTERQNTREKLHEIQYPKRVEEREAEPEPSALILKIRAEAKARGDARSEAMQAEQQKQWAVLRQIRMNGQNKRDRAAIGL